MHLAIKTEWVSALRSGVYKRGERLLKNKDAFCPLGVLCDLHAKATGGKWVAETYHNCESQLPHEVAGWAGLEESNPLIKFCDGRRESIIRLNDICHVPFEHMADLIEEGL